MLVHGRPLHAAGVRGHPSLPPRRRCTPSTPSRRGESSPEDRGCRVSRRDHGRSHGGRLLHAGIDRVVDGCAWLYSVRRHAGSGPSAKVLDPDELEVDGPDESASRHSAETASGRQDLNLRPPGPQPDRSRLLARVRRRRAMSVLSVALSCAHFAPRIAPVNLFAERGCQRPAGAAQGVPRRGLEARDSQSAAYRCRRYRARSVRIAPLRTPAVASRLR